jgi:hypothetical protein
MKSKGKISLGVWLGADLAETQLSASQEPAQAAEPPGDLMLNLPPTEADKAGLDAWSEGYAKGAREAKREAVGIIDAIIQA